MNVTRQRTRSERLVILGTPILLVVFSLLHGTDFLMSHGIGMPKGDEWVRYLSTISGRWLALHVAGLGLFPLLGIVIWRMLPAHGTASRVSRVALALYVVLYPAFDALVGIGSSILHSLPQYAAGVQSGSPRPDHRGPFL